MSVDASFALRYRQLVVRYSVGLSTIQACLRLMKEESRYAANNLYHSYDLALMNWLAVVDFFNDGKYSRFGAGDWRSDDVRCQRFAMDGFVWRLETAIRQGSHCIGYVDYMAVVGVVYVFGVLLFVGG